jgi:hypothetical protein
MNNINRIPNIVLLVVGIITVILVVALVANITSDVKDVSMGNWINNNLIWAYILGIVAIVAVIGFTVYQMVTDLEMAKSGLLGLGFIAVVFLIAFLFASRVMPTFFGVEKFIANGTITPSIVKIIDTALYSTYMIFGLTVVALIYASVSRYFK